MLQPASDIYCREVHGVASQNMFRLDGRQHGVGPAKLRLTLILDRCHGQQEAVRELMLFFALTSTQQQQNGHQQDTYT